MFEELVPNEQMPETMLAAERRSADYAARLAIDPQARPDVSAWRSHDVAKTPYFTARQAPGVKLQWSVDTGGGCPFTQCIDLYPSCGINQTGDGRVFRRDDINKYVGEVCTLSGSWVRFRVTYRTWWNWSTVGDYTVPVGSWLRVSNNTINLDYDVSSIIHDTGPDSYSYRHYAHRW